MQYFVKKYFVSPVNLLGIDFFSVFFPQFIALRLIQFFLFFSLLTLLESQGNVIVALVQNAVYRV